MFYLYRKFINTEPSWTLILGARCVEKAIILSDDVAIFFPSADEDLIWRSRTCKTFFIITKY